jgi:hypothetical protein
VFISWDVVFEENIFPFQILHPNAGSRLHAEILILPEHSSSTTSDHGGMHNNDDHMPIVPITSPTQVEHGENSNTMQVEHGCPQSILSVTGSCIASWTKERILDI